MRLGLPLCNVFYDHLVIVRQRHSRCRRLHLTLLLPQRSVALPHFGQLRYPLLELLPDPLDIDMAGLPMFRPLFRRVVLLLGESLRDDIHELLGRLDNSGRPYRDELEVCVRVAEEHADKV